MVCSIYDSMILIWLSEIMSEETFFLYIQMFYDSVQ